MPTTTQTADFYLPSPNTTPFWPHSTEQLSYFSVAFYIKALELSMPWLNFLFLVPWFLWHWVNTASAFLGLTLSQAPFASFDYSLLHRSICTWPQDHLSLSPSSPSQVPLQENCVTHPGLRATTTSFFPIDLHSQWSHPNQIYPANLHFPLYFKLVHLIAPHLPPLWELHRKLSSCCPLWTFFSSLSSLR